MATEMKKHIITLKEVNKINEDYYIYDFYMPDGIEFVEGQYGVFMHVDKEILGRKVRAFSIASTQREDVFKIGLKIGDEPSDFKQKMLDLKVGEKMLFNGPMGNFTLEEEYESVFIAGGIGITPIRGLLKLLEENKTKKEAFLVYSEPRKIYPFKEEFDKMDFVNAEYKYTIENTKEAIGRAASKFNNKAFYYISGSPGFVGGISEQLIEHGINKGNIKYDRFTGY